MDVPIPADLLRSLLGATRKWWEYATGRYQDVGGIEWAGEACAGETWAQGSRLLRKAEVRALSSPSGDARKVRDWAGPRWRKDGWPLCPFCGEDELFSLSIPSAAKEIHGCYRCNWRPGDPVDLGPPSGDARPPERKPGFNEAMLPDTRELLRRCLTSVPAACSRLRRDIRAAIDASKTPLKPTAPVAPLIPEEPKSPIIDPNAASQNEGGKTCAVCGRDKWEYSGPARKPDNCMAAFTWPPDRHSWPNLVAHWRLGYERQRVEVAQSARLLEGREELRLKAETEIARLRDRMVAAFGQGTDETHLVEIAHDHEREIARADKAEADRDAALTQAQRFADSEAAAVASSIKANADALSEKQRADAAEAEVLRLTKEVQEARGPVMGVCDKRSEARPWHGKIHYETSACSNFRPLELGQAAAIVEDPEVVGDAILYQSLIALLGELAEERDEASTRAARTGQELVPLRERVRTMEGALHNIISSSNDGASITAAAKALGLSTERPKGGK